MEISTNGKVISALLLGTAIGAALGILFALDKGSKTRNKLKNSLKDAADSVKENLADESEAMQSKLHEMGGYAKEKLDSLKEKAKNHN